MNNVHKLLVSSLLIILAGCENTHAPRESITDVLYPHVETQPVDTSGDAADDPAIWINQQTPEKSLVLGTDKKQGLNVYNLKGEILQQLAIGRLNNVDIRYGINLDGQTIDLAAASNRSNNSISLFSISKQGKVSHLNDIMTTLPEVYGLCMYRDNNDNQYVFINDKDGRFQQYQVIIEKEALSGKLVREFALNSQPEGCVADDLTGQLYMGEEAAGIWTTPANPQASELKKIANLGEFLTADVEGMGLYYYQQKPYLVVSSQGSNSYAVYDLTDNYKAIGHFRIGTDLSTQVDEVSETDGLEVTSVALGSQWPDGLLVAQDGYNQLPDATQNFKLVSGTGLRQLIEKWTK
ncbi:phytase [Thalassotalea profundi]|uniref:BPP domain-containing protein n=1 Tax=Thalassotalea profundi TaxID=2036687 RepID=A0ABQ3IYZ1_9GAMM|nr:phytase [Thalassotalea profundi]GHE95841.1 hypothetical protein GCM10011501_26770 [Thalassotalea profundi]